MKKLLSILSLFIVAAMLMTSCDDLANLPVGDGYDNTDNGNNDDNDDGTDDDNDDGTDDGNNDDNDDGTDDGNDDGNDDGTDDGNDDGNDDGTDDGNDDGTDDGNDDGSDDGNDDGSDDGGYTDSPLTPGEHQEKLEKTAIDFIGYFNTSDVESIINAAYNLCEYMDDWEYGAESEDVVVGGDESVGFETEYPEAATRASLKSLFGHIIRGAQNFSSAEFTRFATRAVEEIIIDPDDEENIWSGKCFTYEDWEWIESDISKRNVKFVWDNAEALLTWDDTTTYEYLYEAEEINYVVKVPSNVKFTFKIGGKEHICLLVETNITSMNVWAPNVTVKLNGGYELGASVEADRKGVVTKSHIKKNNKKILSEIATVAINDFTDIDNWFYDEYCEYCDEIHNYFDPSIYIAENAKTGAAQIDILNLSIIAAGDFKGMYEFFIELDDKYDWWDDNGDYIANENKNYYNEVRDYVNDKVSVVLVYNDTKEKVADIVMQTTRGDYDDYYEDYWYYAEPILLFPDGSKFAFESYFTERAFGDLIDEATEFAEKCENLFN